MSKNKTKNAVKSLCREMMTRYDDDQPITGADAEFLAELLSTHPRADEKIGCGIQSFVVVRDDVWCNSRHFAIIRTDGSKVGFSYKVCINNRSHKQTVTRALRTAVVPQILKAKALAFADDPDLACVFTGERLTRDNCHVDHAPPDTFASLVERWMAQEGLEFDQIPVRPSDTNEYTYVLSQREQLDSWLKFHLQNARLRVISVKANLRIVGKKETRTQEEPEMAV